MKSGLCLNIFNFYFYMNIFLSYAAGQRSLTSRLVNAHQISLAALVTTHYQIVTNFNALQFCKNKMQFDVYDLRACNALY